MNAAVTRRKEFKLNREGLALIAGVDEAGIGPLAGPVVAAAVLFDKQMKVPGLDDSKKLTRKRREEVFEFIIGNALLVGVGICDHNAIDEYNVLEASHKAMADVVNSLSVRPQHILVDGNKTIPGIDVPQTTIVHGDRLSHAIAAASVVAKVIRDRIMEHYDAIYPRYRFIEHKGYGTELHIKLLNKYGPSPIHRWSFEPVTESMKLRSDFFRKHRA